MCVKLFLTHSLIRSSLLQCNSYDLVSLADDNFFYVVSPSDVVVAKVGSIPSCVGVLFIL